MDAYLDAAAESAQIMAAEAERLNAGEAVREETASLAAVVGDDGAGQSARWNAYVNLKAAVDALYNAAYTGDKPGFAPFKLAYDDFWGDDDLIRHDAYPALARAYNQRIAAFPGSLVARATGCGPLETFGG